MSLRFTSYVIYGEIMNQTSIHTTKYIYFYFQFQKWSRRLTICLHVKWKKLFLLVYFYMVLKSS